MESQAQLGDIKDVWESNVSAMKALSINLLKALEMTNCIVVGLHAVLFLLEWDV